MEHSMNVVLPEVMPSTCHTGSLTACWRARDGTQHECCAARGYAKYLLVDFVQSVGIKHDNYVNLLLRSSISAT